MARCVMHQKRGKEPAQQCILTLLLSLDLNSIKPTAAFCLKLIFYINLEKRVFILKMKAAFLGLSLQKECEKWTCETAKKLTTYFQNKNHINFIKVSIYFQHFTFALYIILCTRIHLGLNGNLSCETKFPFLYVNRFRI